MEESKRPCTNRAICTLFKKLYLEYITKCFAEQMALEYTLVELANSMGCHNVAEACVMLNLSFSPPPIDFKPFRARLESDD